MPPTTPEFSVRRLTEADAALFREIRLEMLTVAPDAFGSVLADWQDAPEATYSARLADGHVAGLFEGGALVGLAGLHREKGGNTRHRGTITMVYVRPSHRGRGGVALLSAALIAAGRGMGLDQIELLVAAGNAPAIAAYARAGFETVATLPRALKTGSGYLDEHMMMLRLVP